MGDVVREDPVENEVMQSTPAAPVTEMPKPKKVKPHRTERKPKLAKRKQRGFSLLELNQHGFGAE